MRDFSNYYEHSMLDYINEDGNVVFDYSLQNSTDSYDVIIDGEIDIHRAILQTSTYDQQNEKRTVFTYNDVVNRGSLVDVVLTKDVWLVTTIPIINPVYTKTTARLCNASIEVETGESKVIERNEWGAPIKWEEVPDKKYICVAEKSLVYGYGNDKPINIPDNKIRITMPYTKIDFDRFTIYDEVYKVGDIDYTNVINGIGIIILTGERTVEDGNV